MTAKEAREASDKKNESKMGMAKITAAIKEAIRDGEYSCWIYEEAIVEPMRSKLKEMGYKVGKTQFDRNEVLTQISW